MTKRKTKTISRSKAVDLILKSQGKFFTVTFNKNDTTERTINAKRHNSPLTKTGYIGVYSVQDQGFRNVNPRTIKVLNCDNINYKVKQ